MVMTKIISACTKCGKLIELDDISYDWQIFYCSERCWMTSEEFGNKISDLEAFIGSLLPEQRRMLDNLLLDDVLQSNDFYGYITTRIRDKSENTA